MALEGTVKVFRFNFNYNGNTLQGFLKVSGIIGFTFLNICMWRMNHWTDKEASVVAGRSAGY